MPPKRGIARPVKKGPKRSSFIADSDSKSPPAKKSKSTPTSVTKPCVSSSGDGQTFVLSEGKNQKRVNISEFNGVKYVNIREYYEKDDEWLPAKKGISLNKDQFSKLLEVLTQLKAQIGLNDGEEGDGKMVKSAEKVVDSDDEAEPKVKSHEQVPAEDDEGEEPVIGEKVEKMTTENDEVEGEEGEFNAES